MPLLDFGDGGAMIRSANDARRRRDATPLLPSEHAAQEAENARVVPRDVAGWITIVERSDSLDPTRLELESEVLALLSALVLALV
jgi:hypothetical protein